MRERPILFNGAMVRAILAGQKTQSRRPCKPQPSARAITTAYDDSPMRAWWEPGDRIMRCPYGQPGDRLWVRERFKPVASGQVKNGYGEIRYGYAYEADSGTRWNKRTTIIHDLMGQPGKGPMQFQQSPWKSAICMPHRACRLLLEITAVRVERLQDISEADAIAEGAPAKVDPSELRWQHYVPHALGFIDLWNSTGGDWDSNPWVWVIEFKRVEADCG